MLDDEATPLNRIMFSPINILSKAKPAARPIPSKLRGASSTETPHLARIKKSSPDPSKKKKTREPRFTLSYLENPINQLLYERMNDFNPLAASVPPDIVEEVDRKYGPNGTDSAMLKLKTGSSVSAAACTHFWKQSRIAFALDRGDDPPWQWIHEWAGYLKERQERSKDGEDLVMGCPEL